MARLSLYLSGAKAPFSRPGIYVLKVMSFCYIDKYIKLFTYILKLLLLLGIF